VKRAKADLCVRGGFADAVFAADPPAKLRKYLPWDEINQRTFAKVMTRDSSPSIVGNVYNKYQTRNPLARYLFDNFLNAARSLINSISPLSILEVGCGEGYLAELVSRWKPIPDIFGVDLSEEIFDPGVRANPRLRFSAQSAYQLAFPSGLFDLVVGCEVLEHLDSPQRALAEIERVTRHHALLSVPREPLWRILNIARLAYLKDFGNTPGHVHHWTTDEFVRLVEGYFRIVRVATPLPWTMVLAEKRLTTSRTPEPR
jgi:ubiquinone/menaquinone biosynthesis C-methylase UbiE